MTEHFRMSELRHQTRRLSALSRVGRMYPLYSGCGAIANHRIMTAIAPPLAQLAWTRSAGGQICVPLDDHVGRAVFFLGDLDPKLTWILRRIVKPGSTVIDIGANFGLVTILLAKLVGPSGFVHAFEPNPEVVDVLKETLRRNELINAVVHAYALGDRAGKLTLTVPRGNFGAGSFSPGGHGPYTRHNVNVEALDALVERLKLSSAQLLKIDVEGFELEVLTGARDLLSKARPVVVFEINGLADHAKTSAMFHLLRDLEYGFLTVPPCLFRMKTEIAHDDPRPGERVHDVIAVPRGEAFAEMCRRLRAR